MQVPQKLYVISNSKSQCKIGISVNPVRRLKTLQIGNPYRLKLLDVYRVDDAAKLEKSVHRSMNDFHLRGEWFDFNRLKKPELTSSPLEMRDYPERIVVHQTIRSLLSPRKTKPSVKKIGTYLEHDFRSKNTH